jgi:phosphatidylserine/phosphatidylglycerophosphate/cardiolipin synthase-like enzyme
MQRSAKTIVVLFIVIGILLSTTVVLAVSVESGLPAVFFTDNMSSTTTSPDATVMEQALLERINSAVTSIDATLYDFNRDSVRNALIAAKQRGVTVRVVTDDEARHANATYIPYYQALEDAGIPIVDDNTGSAIMHDKYIVFDGQVVWTGSTNYTDNGFTLNHNNGIVFTSTTMAEVYLSDFAQMFAGQFMGAKTPTAKTIDYNGTPVEIYMAPQDESIAAIIEEVNAATVSVSFAIFFFTDDGLRDALIAAKQRGVTVQGLWDALGAANTYSEDETLCAAGIPVKRENTTGKMHNKFMVIDAGNTAGRVVTGSLNWTASGNDSNSENILIVHSPEVSEQYVTAWQAMWDQLDPSTQCDMPSIDGFIVYLPFVVGPVPATPTPTATVTPTPTQTPTSTATPTPTATTPPTTSDLRIATLSGGSTPEYVLIQNFSSTSQNMTGWKLVSVVGPQTFDFPAGYVLGPGATVRIESYTGASNNPPSVLLWGLAAIWRNSGDKALLQNSSGVTVSCVAYGSESCP